MKPITFRVASGLLLVFALSSTARPAAPEPPPASLDRTALAARGTQSALLSVARFGRFALSVKSAQGVNLQLVDRMAGPGEVSGEPGVRDGRTDLLLERGEYKVLTRGSASAKGSALLSVQPFRELNAIPALLVEWKPVEASLADLEQRSYWLALTERRRVDLEAAGRHLTDLRLWKEGTWLVDAAPDRRTVQPRVGKPLVLCQLSTELDAGLYLVTAYGGPSLPWAEEADVHPFHLRFGIPRLGEAGRQRMEVSEFGTDRFVVPHSVNYFRIELPEARPAFLRAGALVPGRPYADVGNRADVTKQSVPPVADLEVPGSGSGEGIVAVSGEAGQPYVLQHFERRSHYPFSGGGPHWLSSLHSGHAEDSVDATAVVVRSCFYMGTSRIEPSASEVVEVDGSHGFARRANLMGTLTLFLRVKDAASYEVVTEGVEARARIEPFLTSRPAGYSTPDFGGKRSTWDLEAGYHVLTVEPVKKGIVKIVVRPKGLVDTVLDAVGLDRPTSEKPVRGSVQFPNLPLDGNCSYTVYLNTQPEVRTGLLVRSLPLDLSDPLFVLQGSGEALSVPFEAREAGVVRAEAEDATALELSVDGATWGPGAHVTPGRHEVKVRHSKTGPVPYSLSLVRDRLMATAPLPPLPDSALATLPRFPLVAQEKPQYFDLAPRTSATFNLRADRPALYRLESTGLLATRGTLRSRIVTSLAEGQRNGVGRNFSVARYLTPGDYQVTVATLGESAGHLGLALTPTDPLTGGTITSGIPARAALLAGGSIAYRFNITRPGHFRLRSVALGREVRCRLEDIDGWPLVTPGGIADLSRYFEPGRYRLVLLPGTTDGSVVTRIDPVASARRYVGHGPHRLPLAARVSHTWLEPAGEATRTPDSWDFTLPAQADLTVELTAEMQAEILELEGKAAGTRVGFVSPAAGFRGTLSAGRYRIQTTAARRNNRVEYQLAVQPVPLVVGLDREVTAPTVVPVSVGDSGPVEIWSFGTADVKARLRDAQGRSVSSSDDRPADWNFAITQALPPGHYQLSVDPVGAHSAKTTLSMRALKERVEAPLALPASEDLQLGTGSVVRPVALPAGAELLVVKASSAEAVGVTLEAQISERWQSVGSAVGRTARLEVLLGRPTSADSGLTTPPLRLRIFSLDRRGSPVHLVADAVSSTPVVESDLARGITLQSPGAGDQRGAAVVTLDRPGLFRVQGDELRWCTVVLAACTEARDGLVSAPSARMLAVGARGQRVTASRVALGPAAPMTLGLSDSAVLADVETRLGGPVVVMATARQGQPGVAVLERGAGSGDQSILTMAPMATEATSAVGVELTPRHPVVRLFAASPTSEAFDARVETVDFAKPSVQPLTHGIHEGPVAGTTAQAFTLPRGTKRTSLTLDAGMVAVLSRGDTVSAIFWPGNAASTESTQTDAEHLTVLNTRTTPARFLLEMLPLMDATAPQVLSEGHPVEQRHMRAGIERLNVEGRSGAVLHVRGARSEATFVGRNGRVIRGFDLPLENEKGFVRVEHGVGPVMAWIDGPGREVASLWARTAEAPPHVTVLPALVPLSGEMRSLRLEPKEPVLLSLRSAGPVVTLLQRGDDPPEVDLHAAGLSTEVLLPKGRSILAIRPFGASSLSGEIELTSTPVTPIAEGLGPETVFGPGQSRLFSFETKNGGAVGIGVRASADTVETVLMTARGKVLGRGALQMPTLEPGTYLLALRIPPDGASVTARPILAGLAPPDSGPPADVVRRYVENGEPLPSYTARQGRASDSSSLAPEPSDEGTEGVGDAEGEGEGGWRVDEVERDEEAVSEEAPVDETPLQDAPVEEGGAL